MKNSARHSVLYWSGGKGLVVYAGLLRHDHDLHHVAVRDFLRPPNVRDINVSGYTGKPGEDIVIRAVDDCEVVSVHIALANDGVLVEEGEAVRHPYNATLWRYTTTEENEIPGTVIEAQASDRPGNVTAGRVEI